MKVLLIKPSSLGDVVHALPTAHLLRRNFPDAFIAWLVNDSLVGLLKNCPAINALIPFHRERWGKVNRFPEFLQFLGKLREQQFDMVIDLQGLFRSGVIARGSGAVRRIGLSDAREGALFFCNETVTIPSDCTHAVDRYVKSIEHLGFSSDAVEFPFGESAEDKAAVDEFLRGRGAANAPLIAISPSARWENKRWPAESFADLVRELTGQWKPHRVVLIGGSVEASYLESIAQQSGASPVIMAGKLTLSQLVELLRRCTLYFGNDSGPTHIATALRVPTVELFGPTNPALTGPHASQLKHTVVLRTQIPCSPCLKPTCGNKVYLECLKTILVKEVLGAAGKLMGPSLEHR
ncbi:MAG: glycosyltransferase family 9 protein [Verrucomicrobiae bacterium]|nr:glycosyltransferase family 9 protein [Verrucomicrobiae bacterium]